MKHGPFPASAYKRAYSRDGDYLRQWAADAAAFRREARHEPEFAAYWHGKAEEREAEIMCLIAHYS